MTRPVKTGRVLYGIEQKRDLRNGLPVLFLLQQGFVFSVDHNGINKRRHAERDDGNYA